MSSIRTSLASSLPTAAPSPAASIASNGKRKREEPQVPYSQPASTGFGQEIMTQVVYAVDHMKEKDKPLSFKEIINYLSLQNAADHDIRTLRHILRTHNRVRFDPKGNNGEGSYSYKPIHNVKSADELKAYLQNRNTAQGVSVKELKDGWKGADKVIAELERKHEILVTHLKKDNQAKMVWQNDPSMTHKVDEQFHKMWHTKSVPSDPEEVRQKLEAAGLKPASEAKRAVATKPKEKRRKVARRSGKTTNTHMMGILRDYSHKQK
jgi:transcription initiation factor TFIIE subunit beta